MKLLKGFSLPIIVSVFILSFSACSSIPKPSSPQDTLLVIHTQKDMKADTRQGLNFWLYLKDGSKFPLRFSHEENLSYISGLGPGVVEFKMIRVSLDSGISSTSGWRYFDYPLPVKIRLESGSYYVFPATIIYHQFKRPNGTSVFNLDLKKIEGPEMESIVAALEEKEVSHFWTRAE